ncbi:MAG: RNA 2',3'-cyclic phosphodiesterase [Lachnospiraceae bacterium]|nr:RNA 2',3'-cyclic phosphodiesterase [Lachnospiraceae bacterium]
MRLFIAVDFEEEIKQYILSVQKQLKAIAKKGNFTRPENFHLTLIFLGEVSQSELPSVLRAVDSVEQDAEEFLIDGIGRFPRDGGDIWWLGVKDYKGIAQIQSFLSRKLCAAGFSIESRAFRPHLTLARECIVSKEAALPAYESKRVKAERISVMKSERIAGKLVYTELYAKTLRRTEKEK